MPSYSGVFTLQAQMQAIAANNWPAPPPTVIGQAFGGGFYAGQVGVSGVATYYIIVGPVASAQTSGIKYKNAGTATTGADSVIDGSQNTADIVADGNSTVYPAGHFCNDLVIGGYTDWYMPAKNELEVCYYNLKPTTSSNFTNSGANLNAIPPRASNYTAGTPAQTSVVTFQSGGTEAFTGGSTPYWSSSESTAAGAWASGFETNGGYQYVHNKANSFYLRAIRRVAV